MKILNNFLFFYGGKDCIYSNWYRGAEFTDYITGIKFPTSEQAFMWYKADFFKDLETSIMLENFNLHPKEAKELGRGVSNYNELAWNLVKMSFMMYVVYLKFSQNEKLKEELLSHTKVLVEASPYDKIWGIGLGLDTPDEILADPINWKGTNYLGEVLGDVREMLR